VGLASVVVVLTFFSSFQHSPCCELSRTSVRLDWVVFVGRNSHFEVVHVLLQVHDGRHWHLLLVLLDVDVVQVLHRLLCVVGQAKLDTAQHVVDFLHASLQAGQGSQHLDGVLLLAD